MDLMLARPLVKLTSHHLIAVDDHTHRLADKITFAVHAPADPGLIALRLEREFRRIRRRKRLEEFQPEPDQFMGTAFGDRHISRAHLTIAIPAHFSARSGVGTLKGCFSRRIHLRPWGPSLPVVQIVHLSEHGGRRSGHDGRSRIVEIVRPSYNVDDERNNNDNQTYEDFDNHSRFLLSF